MSEAAGNAPIPLAAPSPVPLPAQPKGNRLLLWISVLCFLAGVLGFAWSRYVQSSGYQARRQLAHADQLARDGNLADAARAYHTLAVDSPRHAADALANFKKLLDKPLDEAPLKQVAVVLDVAASWPELPQLREGMAERGLKLLEEKGDKDVEGALVVLNLVVSPRMIKEQKHFEKLLGEGDKLLAGWVKTHPDNIEVLTNFAYVLQRRNDPAGIEKLLAPHREKLGSGNGAWLLAWGYLNQGKNDRAQDVLEPYCKDRLPKLIEADAKLRKAREELESTLLPEIEKGTAPDFDYDVYRRSDKPTQQVLRGGYIRARLLEKPEARAAEKALQQQYTLDHTLMALGQLQVAKARSLVDPAARKAALEKARETFLALRGTLADNADFRLRSAEVAYWMGEPKEGQKVLDELLEKAARAPQMLLQVAETYRAVGEFAPGRKLIEEAHDKAKDAALKNEAAFRRARMEVDVEDGIAWLKKCDNKRPEIQVALLQSQARQAEQRGNYPDGAELLRKSLALLAGFPKSPQTDSETGVTSLWLFRLSGDKTALEKGLALLVKSAADQPAQSIIVNNAALNVYQAACIDLAMDSLEPAVLRSREALNLVEYFYNDRAGREEQAARLRKHAGLSQARELAEKLLTLQPRQSLAYEILAPLRAWNRDVKGLKELEAQLNKVGLDESDNVKARQESLAGKRDEPFKQERGKAIERWEALAAEMRAKKKDWSVAVALTNLVRVLLRGEEVGETIDADRVVKLAEEAQTAHLCRATTERLVDALLYRAHRQLIQSDAGYKKMAERSQRSLDPSHLMGLALTREGTARALASANPDVIRVCKLLKERSEAFPDEPSPWLVAMLQKTHPDAAAKVAAELLSNELFRALRSITLKVKPLSLLDALEAYWALQVEGKEKDGEALLKALGERGVPLPFDIAK